jgi:hypothetical protein
MIVALINVFNDTWVTKYDAEVHNLQNMETTIKTFKL